MKKNKLTEICERKRAHVAMQRHRVSESQLRNAAQAVEKPRGFLRALQTANAAGHTGLIAEIKKASPSKGVIRHDFNPEELAKAYVAGGATCLSVLTDAPYFQGADAYLPQAKAACNLPCLRKDFMVDPYQILESRALGADCILLIMAALTNEEAITLEKMAFDLGMDVLVEVHNEEETERALTHLETTMLGVNNRDLKTLEVDLSTTERLANIIPAHYTKVCESGIATHADITRMKAVGVSCFLVGESLMRERDVTLATRNLLGMA